MDTINKSIFNILRAAAILFYLLATISGIFVLVVTLGQLFSTDRSIAVDTVGILLSIALTIIPAIIGFVLDRLSIIGTTID